MVHYAPFRPDEVWAKSAYGPNGGYLGKVEAIAYRRGTLVRVGVPAKDSDRRGLKFYSVDGARLDGERLILAAAD